MLKPLEISKKDLLALPSPVAFLLSLKHRMYSVKNGVGLKVDVQQLLCDFALEIDKLVASQVSNKSRIPPTIFVPDLWHLAYGDAKSMIIEEESEKLWDAAVYARTLAGMCYGTQTSTTRYNYPGNKFSKPFSKGR